MRRIRRDGLRRIEVAVVVAVLAVVSGLLVVGVQKVRDTARQANCVNNLRQIGLAVAACTDVNSSLPSAAHPPAHLPPDQRLGWLMVILPFCENTNLYRRSGPWDNEDNTSALVHYRLFVCPTAGDATTTVNTNYFGITGLGPDSSTLPADHPRAGVFAYDRRTTLTDVSDGVSNTMLVLEGGGGGPWTRAGSATLRAVDPTDRPYLGPDRPFGGRHGAIHNLLLADGSVREVRTTLPPVVLEALATIAGKESLPAEW